MQDELQSPAPDGTEGSVPSQDAADATPSPSAPDERKELLDRLAQEGRERVAAQQKLQYLEGQLGYAGQVLQNQNQQLSYIQSQMNKQQWQDFEARLQTMSPVDAANERARVAMEYSRDLERRLTASRQAPPVQQRPQQRQETDDEYSTRVANEKLAVVNRKYSLTGDAALKLSDMPSSAWADPDTFTLEAGTMAQKRSAERENLKPVSQDKIQDLVAKEVARQKGASRSMSPSPSSGEPDPGSEEVARMAAQHVTNRKGPAASIAELRKHREQLAAKIGQ